MICVDAMLPCVRNRNWPYDESCHMFDDAGDLARLHAFAEAIGLKRAWFQNHARLPHYDLTKGRRFVAVRKGARSVDRAFVARVMSGAPDPGVTVSGWGDQLCFPSTT